MKIQSLRILTASLAVYLAPVAFASVTINDESFDSFKMSLNTTGGVILTTEPPAVVVDAVTNLPVAIPVLPSDVLWKVERAAAEGDITITLPDEIQPVNCTLAESKTNNPIACPPVTTPPPGTCTDGAPFFETLAWSNQPRKVTVVTGKLGTASKFTTTASNTYQGNFQVVPDSASGNLMRRVWFSECPGGPALEQTYTYSKGTISKCDVKGTEPVIFWTQQDTPTYLQSCKLKRGRTYYLNYRQTAGSTGAGPSSSSRLFRSSGVGGKP